MTWRLDGQSGNIKMLRKVDAKQEGMDEWTWGHWCAMCLDRTADSHASGILSCLAGVICSLFYLELKNVFYKLVRQKKEWFMMSILHSPKFPSLNCKIPNICKNPTASVVHFL
jgi:hypothetical protein